MPKSEPLGFSVRVFIPSGNPEGPRVIEKSNWTGLGLVFPRSLFKEIRGRDELKRPGVYVLWGPSDSGQLPRAYVGQGDEVLRRLDSHANNKEFWTHGVAFSSKDQSLNKAHVQHIEARLVRLAEDLKRCELENSNIPQQPSLSEADLADAELYLADVLLCLPVLGVRFFERPKASADDELLFLKAKGITAQGYEDAGKFVVRAGSQGVKEEVTSIHAYLSDLRTTLLHKGILADAGDKYHLVQDYWFASPSTASGVLLGRSSNGREEWKDREGRTLKSIQEAQADAP